MTNSTIYQDIATRTAGDIYIGVVGPVRTGKSTFIKSFTYTSVLIIKIHLYCLIFYFNISSKLLTSVAKIVVNNLSFFLICESGKTRVHIQSQGIQHKLG